MHKKLQFMQNINVFTHSLFMTTCDVQLTNNRFSSTLLFVMLDIIEYIRELLEANIK